MPSPTNIPASNAELKRQLLIALQNLKNRILKAMSNKQSQQRLNNRRRNNNR